jgi:Ala-tRNA(Pro) deacylase
VQAAHDWGADLIVIGTHGRGRFSSFILGSTAEAVIRRATCPVLTVAHDPVALRKVKDLLDSHQVRYVSVAHSPAYTSQEVAQSAHVKGREMAKTTMVKLDGELAMVVVPSSERVDLERLREVTGAANVVLATESEFRGLFPDCEPGAMPPFGNLYGLRVFVSDHLARAEWIAFNAGSHVELIRMTYKDYEKFVHPVVANVTAVAAHAPTTGGGQS